MAESPTPLPRSGWMQLQPAPTGHSSVTEEQEHFSVPKVGRGACFRLGFHSHTVIRVHPAKLPTLCECIQKRCPALGQALPGTAAALPTPGCSRHGQPRVRSAGEASSARGCPERSQHPPACPPLRGSASLPPRGRRGQSPVPGFGSYHFAVLGLSPVARGRGIRSAAAPCSALTGRQGVEGGAGAGGQPRVRTVQQAFPALLLQALVHPLQLEVTYHVWGTARGPRREKILQRRPPRREGRGREPGGALLSPDRRYQPAGARCCAGQRQHQPDRGVPAASPPPALALPVRPPPPSGVPGGGKRSPIPPPSPAGTRPSARGAPGAAPPAGSAGRGWGQDGDVPRSSTACAVRRFPAVHLSGEGGREPGSALPFPRPPRSVPAARSRALPRHGARSAPPARPLAPEGTGQPPRTAGRGCLHRLWLPLLIPSLLPEFPLSYVFPS